MGESGEEGEEEEVWKIRRDGNGNGIRKNRSSCGIYFE